MSTRSLQHPLVQAAASNDVDILRKLLRQGVDPNEEMSGTTALAWAARTGSLESVQELLQSGADAQRRDASGRTAADWAWMKGHAAIESTLIAWSASHSHDGDTGILSAPAPSTAQERLQRIEDAGHRVAAAPNIPTQPRGAPTIPVAHDHGEDLFGTVAEIQQCAARVAHERSTDEDPSHRAGDPLSTQRGVNLVKAAFSQHRESDAPKQEVQGQEGIIFQNAHRLPQDVQTWLDKRNSQKESTVLNCEVLSSDAVVDEEIARMEAEIATLAPKTSPGEAFVGHRSASPPASPSAAVSMGYTNRTALESYDLFLASGDPQVAALVQQIVETRPSYAKAVSMMQLFLNNASLSTNPATVNNTVAMKSQMSHATEKQFQEDTANILEAESWAAQRATVAREQLQQTSQDQRKAAPINLMPRGNKNVAMPKGKLHAHPKQRPTSPDIGKPTYPAVKPAYAYAIQPGRADAIMAAAERGVANVDKLDHDTFLEMMSEANLSQAALENKWMNSSKLKVEFAQQERLARKNAAPTELPVHDYLEAEVHTGEGWPEPCLDGEDHTVIRSDSTPTAKVNISSLLGKVPHSTRATTMEAEDTAEVGQNLSPSSISARHLLGSCKAITPPSSMKAVAKGLSSEYMHREEQEDKRKHELWVQQNAERMATFEAQKQDAKERIRQLEADLMESDDDEMSP